MKPFIQVENNAKAGAYWAKELCLPAAGVVFICEFLAAAAPSASLEQAVQAELLELLLKELL